jgi:hypothetical protein
MVAFEVSATLTLTGILWLTDTGTASTTCYARYRDVVAERPTTSTPVLCGLPEGLYLGLGGNRGSACDGVGLQVQVHQGLVHVLVKLGVLHLVVLLDVRTTDATDV